jgi:hypothetical protein
MAMRLTSREDTATCCIQSLDFLTKGIIKNTTFGVAEKKSEKLLSSPQDWEDVFTKFTPDNGIIKSTWF